MSALSAFVCSRPRRILGGAFALLVLAAIFGTPLVSILQTSLSDFENSSSQTARAARMIERATRAQDDAGFVVLVNSGQDARKSRRALENLAEIVHLLAKQPGFRSALDYPRTFDRELLSKNGHEALILATFSTRALSYQAAQRLRHAVGAHHGEISGLDIVFEELTHRSRSDLVHAELYALPILIVLSLLFFGGLVAALLPLLVGGLAVLFTFLCLRIVDQVLGLTVFALDLVIALGLGLAVDYSLFVLARFREELASAIAQEPAGRSSRSAGRVRDSGTPAARRLAIERTLASAGRTVLFSCLTVACALASLCVFPLPFLYSMGIAGIFTALMAGAVALLVAPAALFLLGDRVNALSLRDRRGDRAKPDRVWRRGFWSRLANAVMRRPGKVALLSGVVLLAAGSPVFQMGLTPASAALLPPGTQSRQVEEKIERNFATNPALPITAVIHASPTEFTTVYEYAQAVASASGDQQHAHLLYLKGSTWLLAVTPRGDPFGAANEAAVARMRAVHSTHPTAVGGITAWFHDELASIAGNLPYAVLIIALTMFMMVFALTGSLLLPIKTLIMNMLTLSVATGALVLCFQNGLLAGPLHFKGNGGLEPSNLILLYTVAFALASDYGVFLLARIKEAHDRGSSNREAVALGMERTGRLISAAAALFCVAVAALCSSSILSIKELGFGAAFAVAIDATIVRALLVPSLMILLGDWNWWAPRPLRNLHARLGLREGAAESASAKQAGALSGNLP
jgi:uncharacterized membrane protein YdfJ with MMPL/SSD domain